ncbi:tyrosine-type recombinase/integrase [Caenimonas koreensis DSM 17982]|uniref:Tyrosine-type recombinase/integrase n=1 Tax=Caenimonas koreensis DSM 17982 TaxID=1121255 RepID=A0A844B890_9BURK|nr:tyrosine-type recombinase/integrase [Caenimonas koreensis]MRD49373.1 tyrosine-type recombinase/integrase [Caenimonas koreensis DSM 17982]
MPSPRPLSPLKTDLGNGRLATHHFSFLRALAEGLPALDAARRYLGVEGVAEAHAAHRAVVDQVQALARRRREKHWRLVGIEIRATPPSSVPSMADWAESEGLDGWSEAELLEMYQQRFGALDASARRRAARNERMRAQRLQLLKDLEVTAAERPSPLDPLDGWLNPELADELLKLGDLTLANLRARIARGGQWWRGLAAYGPTKAARLARYVELLLGEPMDSRSGAWPLATAQQRLTVLSGREGVNRADAGACATEARDDREAVRAWIAARAGSPHTAAQYEREAERFLLWCVIERRKALSDATAEDCRAYMDFIANVPSSWISRRKVARLAPGWAPFRGPLTLASQAVAIAAVHSLFAWLVQARYLVGNPWALVNRKLGDDPRSAGDDPAGSRAFTPAVWAAIKVHLAQHPNTASAQRLAWLCVFVEATGLRAAELLRARRGDLKPSGTGWLLRVHGKGRKNRTVPVPSSALAATRYYFEARGMDFDSADNEAPLLASLTDPTKAITYRALAETFSRLVKRVIPTLPLDERRSAERASTHWLRHTHATRAAEREVPLDVLQENLGQSDPRTTARYYRAQIVRRQDAMELAFGRSLDQVG